MPNTQYYSLKEILKRDCDYNIIFGERSNGKTYAVLQYALQDFYKSGYKHQLAIIRRWKEDLRLKRADSFFSALCSNDEIKEITNGEYEHVTYNNGKWYLSNYDSSLDKYVLMAVPFAYGFALSEMEHDKSTSFPNVVNILFDEFLTRRYYLPDEFILFMNALSTIIRDRDNVKIFMLGNTVNKYNPYFKEMGLKHADSMQQGTIDVYKFGNSKLQIAVEYIEPTSKKTKASNKYFCFDNCDAVQMIINGKWELAIYPHLDVKYDKKDIVFTYFIKFNDAVLQCEIICKDNLYFTYVHEKSTPIKDDDIDLIYDLVPNEKSNYRRKLLTTETSLQRKIAMFYATEKVFYQNNELGEIVRNYIMQSQKTQYS